jgi:hypothetical protein
MGHLLAAVVVDTAALQVGGGWKVLEIQCLRIHGWNHNLKELAI